MSLLLLYNGAATLVTNPNYVTYARARQLQSIAQPVLALVGGTAVWKYVPAVVAQPRNLVVYGQARSYICNQLGANLMFSPKDPAESIVITYDFTSWTTSALNSPTVTCTRKNGSLDPSPSAVLSGGPTISGQKILQRVVGGIDGCFYDIKVQVVDGNGNTWVLSEILPVVAS